MTRRLLFLLTATVAACSDSGSKIGAPQIPPELVEYQAAHPETTQPDTVPAETSAPDRSEMDTILDRHRLPGRDARFQPEVYGELPDFDGPASLFECDLIVGESQYTGPCYGIGDDGGGITVWVPGEGAFFGDVRMAIAGPDGGNWDRGRGFTMTRSQDEAEYSSLRRTSLGLAECWKGEDFRLCTKEHDNGEAEMSPGDMDLLSSMQKAQEHAAIVMDRHRIESHNVLFEDSVYSELPPAAAHNGARLVRCNVSSVGEYYNGPCHYLSEPDGGFSLTRPDGGDLSPNVPLIALAKTGDTTGEVRGLTRDGINSRWGEAERSEADPACWGNVEFEICANSL